MNPKRTEVWFRRREDAEEVDRVVVISCDDWNLGRGSALLCVPLESFGQRVLAPGFDIAFEQDERRWVIRAGLPFGVARHELVDLDEDVLIADGLADELDASILRIIDLPATRYTADPPPTQRQARFAELHIAGQSAKPVVIISGPGYADRLNSELVVGARMSSKLSTGHRFDVEVRGREGKAKVVCSELYTISRSDLRLRQGTPDPPALTAAQWSEIRTRLLEFLGLS